jgi:hypothetical protein
VPKNWALCSWLPDYLLVLSPANRGCAAENREDERMRG